MGCSVNGIKCGIIPNTNEIIFVFSDYNRAYTVIKPYIVQIVQDYRGAHIMEENSSNFFLSCLCFIILIGIPFWRFIGSKLWRRYLINSHEGDWGKETCQKLINKTISIDMTQDMVRLSLGKPAQIDSIEVTASSKKERWVYGTRGQAAYIWFKDGKITKIKGSGS